MNSTKKRRTPPRALRGAVLIFTAVAVPLTPAATVWTGPLITYTQPATDPTQEANQDRITPNVWLTRGAIQGLFNAKTETFFTHFSSPLDTEWANGTTADFATLTYTNWNSWANGVNPGPPSTVGVNAVVHLLSEDIYLDIKFTFWGGAAGGFAYERSTPGVGLPSPTVSINNPISGAVFAAPANVQIAASAEVSGGSVTNVAFFGNGVLLGSDQTAPFGITTGSLAANSYSLTAVATAAGVSSTSSVVSISVVAPAEISLSSQQISGGQFSFNYTANPGLAYVVQNSSNLVNWLPVVTNVAASNAVHFTGTIGSNNCLFYRVGRLPNP